MNVKTETWCVTSGWLWRVVGETDDYGCVLKESNFPCVNQEEAELQAQEWIDKEINHADKEFVLDDYVEEESNDGRDDHDPGYEPPNCYIPGYGWTVI